MRKQGAMRSAPSEQCDYVFEGQIQVLEAPAKATDTAFAVSVAFVSDETRAGR